MVANYRIVFEVIDLEKSMHREVNRVLKSIRAGRSEMVEATKKYVADKVVFVTKGRPGSTGERRFRKEKQRRKEERKKFTTLYQRVPRMLQDLAVARHYGRYPKVMAALAKCEVLVLDDLLLAPLSRDDQRELLKIVVDRYDRKATIVTSQLPVKA